MRRIRRDIHRPPTLVRGVGMSSTARNVMAVQGSGYADILAHYYPGTALIRAEGWNKNVSETSLFLYSVLIFCAAGSVYVFSST